MQRVAPEAVGKGSAIEALQRRLLVLSPKNDAQQWLKSNALRTATEIAEAGWLIIEQAGTNIQWPFLAILIFWLAMIFASFGLFAPGLSARRERGPVYGELPCAIRFALRGQLTTDRRPRAAGDDVHEALKRAGEAQHAVGLGRAVGLRVYGFNNEASAGRRSPKPSIV